MINTNGPIRFEDPFWMNKEQKQLMVIVHELESGKKIPTSISGLGGNADYDAVLRTFTEEEIDDYTRRREERKMRDQQARMDRQQVDNARRKDEALFEAKLEAFEIPIVKSSKNKELKAKIRRSKNHIEVFAYTAMLIMAEEKLIEAGE